MDNSQQRKKVLILAYFFAPTSAVGGGVIRTLKFVKYLPGFGWRPYVVTVCDSFLAKDDSLIKDIPESVSVSRVRQIDPRYLSFKNRGLSLPIKSSFKRFSEKFCFDSTSGWILPAILRALVIIKREKIDLIFITVPPFSSLIAGYILKKLTGKQLVVDYRDLINSGKVANNSANVIGRLGKKVEKVVIESADAIITTSEESRDLLADEVKRVSNKLYVLNNGFDSEDLAIKNSEPASNGVNIYYSGYLYGKRCPYCFFDVLADLINRKVLDYTVKITILGSIENGLCENGSIQSLIINGNLLIEPLLGYKEALNRLSCADAFLLTSDIDIQGMIPGKLYEYMSFGKPILAFAPKNSATFNFINRFDLGIVIDYKDKDKIDEALPQLYQQIKYPKMRKAVDQELLKRFERKTLTKKLAQIFDHLVN